MARCGYCHEWDAGHNRIGCPKRKEKVALLRVEQENGEHEYYPSLLSEDDKLRAKKYRKCSYCYNRHYVAEHGHNRRTCPRLKADRLSAVEMNKTWRMEAIQFLKNQGLGPGAIIRVDRYGVGIIRDLVWENLGHLIRTGDLSESCIVVEFFKYARTTRHDIGFRFPVHATLANNRWGAWKGPTEILVPATARVIDANMPDDWFEGRSGLDFYFDKEYDDRV